MKRSGIAWKVSRNSVGRAARAGAVLLLSLLLCLAAKGSVLAQGKAYVAVFYRTFEDAEDPEAADVRAALNAALADAGIAYREYDGGDDPLIQLAQIVQEQDAMLLIVNPAEQEPGDTEEKTGEKAGEKTEEETKKNTVADIGADVAADIIVQTDGRPLIFFGCEISEEMTDGAEELCVLVNAAEPETETGAELETEIAGAEAEIGTESGTETGKEIETENGITRAEAEAETETGITRAEAETEPETEITGAEAENETETEIGSASEPPKKNLQGMADAIALIAGNYMTGAGYFEGIEEDWITDEWRVDVPCLFLK